MNTALLQMNMSGKDYHATRQQDVRHVHLDKGLGQVDITSCNAVSECKSAMAMRRRPPVLHALIK